MRRAPTLFSMDESPVVARVLGTEDATPLEFWVGVQPDAFLQLDDVVALDRALPGGQTRAHVRHRLAGAHPP